MPRYFFNVHDGHDIRDDVGTELAGLDEARRFSVSLSADLLREHAQLFWSGEQWKMDVTDDRGLVLFTLLFIAIDAPAVSVTRYKPQNDLN